MPHVVEHLKFKLCPFNGGLNLGWILLPLFRTWTHIAKRVLIEVSARILFLLQRNVPQLTQEENYEVWWNRSTAPLCSLAKVSVILENQYNSLTNKVENFGGFVIKIQGLNLVLISKCINLGFFSPYNLTQSSVTVCLSSVCKKSLKVIKDLLSILPCALGSRWMKSHSYF